MRRNEIFMVKSGVDGKVVTSAVGDDIASIAHTWALLMQIAIRTGPNSVEEAAPATLDEVVQYHTIAPSDVGNTLRRAVALLAQNWGYGRLLKNWWRSIPEEQRPR
jgi:hypothetical protein